MIPVKQTRFAFGGEAQAPGNCYAACIASIFEVGLDGVPDEAVHWKPGMPAEKSWAPHEKEIHDWLYQRGYILITVRTNQLMIAGSIDRFRETYNIISGPSPRNPEFNHAVVGLGNNIAHDPHPSNDGLAGDPNKDWWYEIFVPVGKLR